jgi:hypothetical protein
MRRRAGMGAEAMEVGGMEVAGMGAEATEVGGMEVAGMVAGGGEALGLVSASASGRTGGRIGGHTGADTGDPMPMATPMAIHTHRWSPPHRPKSISNPHPKRPFSLLHQPLGITVTTHRGITPTYSNVQGDGEPWPPRRHKS